MIARFPANPCPRAALLGLLVSPLALWGQTAPTQTTPAPTEPTVVLSAFTVQADPTSPYQGKEANSAGRIRMALIDTPQSVSVITKDFIDDIGTARLLDAMKFSASVTESNFPSRLGRITLRGFQQDAAQNSFFVDGFRYSAISAGFNLDSSNLERIEIVKGPNAIIAAAGSPGGAVNMISKSPSFTRRGYLKVQGSQYQDSRAEVDVTGPLIGDSVAYRLIVMNSRATGYQDNAFNDALLVDPSLTFVLGPNTQITLKGHFAKMDTAILNLPIDPRVTTETPITLYPGLTKRWSGTSGREDSNPGDEARATLELTHKFTDHLQMRTGLMYAELSLDFNQDQISGGSTPNRAGGINPNTGLYTPGTNWTVLNYGLPNQTVVSSPAALPDFTNRSGRIEVSRQRNADDLASFQQDFVYERLLANDTIRSTTVAGFSYNRHEYRADSAAAVSAPLVGTIDNADYTSSRVAALASPFLRNFVVKEVENTRQWHLSQLLRLWDERLLLSAGVSRMSYGQYITPDSVFTTTIPGVAPTPVPAGTGFVGNAVYPTKPYDRIENAKTDSSLGLVYKVRPDVSVFFGRTSNTNPPTLNNIGGISTQNQFGEQWETGIKTSLLEGRVDASLTYFDIEQNNVFVYDIITNTFLPLGTTTSKGTEFEVNARLGGGWSMVGAASFYKARNGFDQLLRGVPDRSGALSLKYEFKEGALRGLWLMLAADYLGRRAGDIPGGISIDTATAKPGTVVGTVNGRTLDGKPVSPTFYLEERTIFNLTGGYTFNEKWKLWFKVENLADKDYIMASLNRGTVFPGTPRSLTGSLTYKF